MNVARSKRKLTAIFSASAVGYNSLIKASETWILQNLEEDKRLISELVFEYKGHVISSTEDNFMAGFYSIINAVECAVMIEDELNKKYAYSDGKPHMEFCFGIDIVETMESDSEL